MRLLITVLFLIASSAYAQDASSWPEADQLFRTDPHFIGADAAYSVDLGKGRVLWLFGDTYIPRDPQHPSRRSNFYFLHNSIAIQSGYDPSQATIKFYWPTRHHRPTEQFPNEHDIWMWIGSGIRVDNALWIFANRIEHDDDKRSLGFKSTGWNAYLITNPDRSPSAWKPKKVMQSSDKVIMGAAFLEQDGFVYIFGSGDHGDLFVARQTKGEMSKGKISVLHWWNGHDWSGSITSRQRVMTDSGTELSIQRDPRGSGFLEINSQGFGASTIVMRRAASITGPWSETKELYRPPESDKPDPFVYAGKSHPELLGSDLILTYVTNNFNEDNADDFTRYFPRFVRVRLPIKEP